MAETATITPSILDNPFIRSAPSIFSSAAYLYKASLDYNAPDVDYDILQLKARDKELQAEELRVQVEQDANNLREQFNQAVGDYQYNTARRGVKVGEGSAAKNVEESAINVGKDVRTARDTAENQAGMLEQDANRIRKAADAAKDMNKSKREAEMWGDIANAGNALMSVNWDNMSPKKTPTVPKKEQDSTFGNGSDYKSIFKSDYLPWEQKFKKKSGGFK